MIPPLLRVSPDIWKEILQPKIQSKNRQGDENPGKASRMEQEENEKLEASCLEIFLLTVEFVGRLAVMNLETKVPFCMVLIGLPLMKWKLAEDMTNLFGGQRAKRKPVWVDEEEERTEVDLLAVSRLRNWEGRTDEK
ncbi:hypothetical protein HPP92_026114 [Vanilla planifolia]|uniref:Uncharacterized protein n=1 Tax=Vanilla planifolia TaxID=51239 RepID=A0A835PGC5_VANPL|nr:hypothetical protein HPP92_026114 [Vanilla planifolia]